MKHLLFGTVRNGYVQFIRFFILGGSSAIVDLAVYSFCLYIFTDHVYSIYAAAFFGYAVGMVWNYVISIYWVFSSTNKLREFLSVCMIAAGGLVLTWVLLYLLADLLHINAVLAKMISQVLILGWNFGLRKWWVFASK